MKFIIGTLILFFLWNISVFAQRETDERVIGFKYELKFTGTNSHVEVMNENLYSPFNPNYKGPTILTTPHANSICDTLGNLLFYYDGASVYQPNGKVMSNGILHNYNFNSEYTNSLIVPIEESNRRYYYLFETIPHEENWDYDKNAPLNCPVNMYCFAFWDICKLQYHIIDMHANGGKGEVLKTNIFIADSIAPSISGIKHRNNIDTWVSVLKSRSNIIYNYKITSCKIQNPVISHIPDFEYPQIPYLSYISQYGGLGFQLVYSTMGDYVTFPGTIKSKNTQNSIRYSLFIAPFNNQTGLFDFSNLSLISVESSYCLNLFSHNSKYLYYHDTYWIGNPVWIYQYELSTGISLPFYYNNIIYHNDYVGLDYGKKNDLLIYKLNTYGSSKPYPHFYAGYLGQIKNIDQPFIQPNLIDSLPLPVYDQPVDPNGNHLNYIARNNYIYNFYHPDYKRPTAFPVAKSVSNIIASPACFNAPVTLKGNRTIPVDSLYWVVKKSGQPGWQRFNADTFDLPVSPGTYIASLVSYKYCLPDSATQQFTIEDHPRVHLGEDSVYTCESKSVDLPANTTYTYHWENVYGDVVPNQISETGQYNMVVQNSCGSDEDSLYVSSSILNIANLVTANNDANNDCWKIKSNNSAEKIQVSIYNSWGSAVFSANNYQNNWCPQDENDGIYYYDITYNNACIKKGWVEVMH